MYTITITSDDHLTFQLHDASTNPAKTKMRKKSFFTMLGLGIFIAFYGYLRHEVFFMYYGLFCAFAVLCLGNIYFKWRSKRHYTKHIASIFDAQYEETIQVEIGEEEIRMIDRVSDSTVKICEIILVNEIKDYFFLKLSTGFKMIIPKKVPLLNEELSAMIKKHDIPHVVRLDWKW